MGGHTSVTNPEFWGATKKYDNLNVNFKIVGSGKLTKIEKSLFEYCNCALSIEIPEGIALIKENAFSRCEKITKFTIPASVSSIYNFAWTDCTALKEVTFLGKVEDLEHMLFDGIENLVVKVPAADVEYYKQSNVGGDHDSITIEAIAE